VSNREIALVARDRMMARLRSDVSLSLRMALTMEHAALALGIKDAWATTQGVASRGHEYKDRIQD
jgi:hypothetical protein